MCATCPVHLILLGLIILGISQRWLLSALSSGTWRRVDAHNLLNERTASIFRVEEQASSRQRTRTLRLWKWRRYESSKRLINVYETIRRQIAENSILLELEGSSQEKVMAYLLYKQVWRDWGNPREVCQEDRQKWRAIQIK
jgi:hypothetical protein